MIARIKKTILQFFTTIDKVRINNQIKAPQLRVISFDNRNLGVMSTGDAQSLALEQSLDLVEISPHSDPPVAKIIDFDKYRYEKEKSERKEKKLQKTGSLKHIQLSVRAAKNDLQIRLKQLTGFLEDKHPVEICLRLRGREKFLTDFAYKKMNEFLGMIDVEYKIVNELKKVGNGLSITIIKK